MPSKGEEQVLLQVDADCLESDKAAKDACKQLAIRLGAKDIEEKQAFRSLEGVLLPFCACRALAFCSQRGHPASLGLYIRLVTKRRDHMPGIR